MEQKKKEELLAQLAKDFFGDPVWFGPSPIHQFTNTPVFPG